MEPTFTHLQDVLRRSRLLLEQYDTDYEHEELLAEMSGLLAWLDAVKFTANEVVFRDEVQETR